MNRSRRILIGLVVLLPWLAYAQEYTYEHKVQPKAKPANISFTDFAQQARNGFAEAYKQVENPRILVLFNEKPIQEPGGLNASGAEEVEVTAEGNSSVKKQANRIAQKKIESSSEEVNTEESYGHAVISFKKYIPTQAEWTSKTVAGFDRAELENAIAGPLIDAGAVLTDRQTVLDFHADDIFSAMKRNRLEAQREALKKTADLILSINVSKTDKTIIKPSGDIRVSVPALSVRILSIGDARLLDTISVRAVDRMVNDLGIDDTIGPAKAEVAALMAMNRLSAIWMREAQ